VSGTGNGLDNTMTGNELGNVLDGGSARDTLFGGGGNDNLTGGPDADTFVFSLPGKTSGPVVPTDVAPGVDTITDFVHGTDKIGIVGTGSPGGLVSPDMFVASATPTAAKHSPTLLYDHCDGRALDRLRRVRSGGAGAVRDPERASDAHGKRLRPSELRCTDRRAPRAQDLAAVCRVLQASGPALLGLRDQLRRRGHSPTRASDAGDYSGEASAFVEGRGGHDDRGDWNSSVSTRNSLADAGHGRKRQAAARGLRGISWTRHAELWSITNGP
jgi:hypothetical protein